MSKATTTSTETRISRRFEELRRKGELGLVAYITAGDPTLDATERIVLALAEAGADGVLITDLTPEEAGDYRGAVRARGLDTVFLAAPTSTDARLERIAKSSSGFLYLISRTGVTGAREALPDDLPALVRRARAKTALPIAVGFGISQPGHVSILGGLADAAVVGSALVEEIERAPSADAAAAAVAGRTRILKEAARRGMSRREARP